MKHLILLPLLAVAACDRPPCLADGEPAAVEQVQIAENSREWSSVKLRMNDGTKRVCLITRRLGKHLNPGDVIRGPLTYSSDYISE